MFCCPEIFNGKGIIIMNTKKASCTVFLIAGTLHSIATFYWSFGGGIGLLTVGHWTLGVKEQYGYTVFAGLFVLGLFKLAPARMTFTLYNNVNKLLYHCSDAVGVI